jgi:hypothetical protein
MKRKKENYQKNDDPLADELNFDELEVVALGSGWKKPAPLGRSLKKADDQKRQIKSPTKKASSRRAA